MNRDSRNNSGRSNPFENFPDDPITDMFGKFPGMDDIFKEFFGDITFQDRHNERHMDDSNASHNPSFINNGDRPHLSLINPEITPPSQSEKINSNDNNYQRQERAVPPTFETNPFERMFARHFRSMFEPEYDRPKIGDINPNYKENRRIFSDNNPHSGVRDPARHTPRLPSPYLPNAQGNEVDIPTQSYYRSHSIMSVTTPDGKMTKITTTDENGHTQTIEEVYNKNEDHQGQGEDDTFKRWTPFGYPWHSGSEFRDFTNNHSIPNREAIVNDSHNSNNTHQPLWRKIWDQVTFWKKPSNDNTNHHVDVLSLNENNHFDDSKSTDNNNNNNNSNGNGNYTWGQ